MTDESDNDFYALTPEQQEVVLAKFNHAQKQDQTNEQITDGMVMWLIERLVPDSIGIAKLGEPIGTQVYFTARTVARLLTGQMNDEIEKEQTANIDAMVLQYKRDHDI